MSRLKSGWVLLAATIGITTCLSNAAFAADCGLPVAAPKYEGDEEWRWKNDKGREWDNQVIGVEGETTAIRWPDNNIAYYNKEWLVERVRMSKGEVVEKQGATSTFSTIGQKLLDFPLELGKQWRWSYMAKPSGGTWVLVTYTHYAKVVACENVQTPAGTYPALKIEITQRSDVSGSNNGTYYLWWAPSVKNIIKRQYVSSRWWSDSATDYELIGFGKRHKGSGSETQPASSPSAAPAPPAPTVRQEVPAPPTPAVTPALPRGPWLGVPLGPPSQQALSRAGIPAGRGAMVLPFTKNPSLPPVDLDPGDVILAIDGVEVEGPGHVSSLLAGKAPGTTIQVRAFRGQYQRQGDQPMVVFQGRP